MEADIATGPTVAPASTRERLNVLIRRFGKSSAALPLAVTTVYVLAVALQEKIGVGGGLGWDGQVYGGWVTGYPDVLRTGVSDYYSQRLLPSGVIYSALKALRLPSSTANVVSAFLVANVLLVVLAARSYDVATRHLRVSAESRWLGAVGLFGSFAILKFSAFYPVLTDVWAFAFGMFQLQFYLTGRAYALAAVTFVGAFTWPTLLPIGACMLIFRAAPGDGPVVTGAARAHLNELIAGLLTLAWLWLCAPYARNGHSLGNSTGTIDLTVVRLSLLASAVYLYCGCRQLLDDRRLFDPRYHLRVLLTPRALFTVVLVAAATWLRTRFSIPGGQAMSPSHLEMHVFSALKEPGIFALAHVLYWGPLVAVMAIRWNQLARGIRQAGVGMILVALCAVVLSLNSESRKLVNLAPIFFVFLLPVLDTVPLSRKVVLQLALLTLLFSRVWISFEQNLTGDLSQFPGQMLFMVMGPWMNPAMYLLQAIVVAATSVWLLRVVSSREAASPARINA